MRVMSAVMISRMLSRSRTRSPGPLSGRNSSIRRKRMITPRFTARIRPSLSRPTALPSQISRRQGMIPAFQAAFAKDAIHAKTGQ